MIKNLFNAKPHFHNEIGTPATGYSLFISVSGTDIPVDVFKDSEGRVKWPVKIVLNARGEPDGTIMVDSAGTYRVTLLSPIGRIVWTVDDVSTEKVFSAQGSDTIEATEATVGGKTVVTFKVKENSVGREELKNPRMLLDDGETTELVHQTVDGVEYVVVKAVVPKPSGTETMTLKYADGEVKWVADV